MTKMLKSLIFKTFTKRNSQREKLLRRKSTDGSSLRSCKVVWDIVVGRNHDVAVGSIGEGVPIGLVARL
jgi:hypothetical protein